MRPLTFLTLLPVLFGLWPSLGVHAEVEPAFILQNARQALAAAGTVSYDYAFEGIDPLPGQPNRFSGHFTGSVRLRPADAQHGVIYHATIVGRVEAGSPEMSLTLATDGSRACALDHVARNLTCGDVANGARGLLGWGAYVVLPELAIPSMFEQTLAFDVHSGLDPQTIGNVACDGVRAIQNLPSGIREVWWYFGQADHLPRKQVWTDRMVGLEGEMHFEITNLQKNLDLPDSAFQLAAPPGYTTSEDPGPFVSVNRPAPEFRVITQDGTALSLARLRGQSVLLYFWMPACGYCKAIEPELIQLVSTLRRKESGIEVLGINIVPMPAEELQDLLPPGEASLRLVLDPGSTAVDYRVAATPALTLIDAEGNIRFHAVGAGNKDMQVLSRLLLDP
jgi:thiol-disulfide isomerase/thioredoxin